MLSFRFVKVAAYLFIAFISVEIVTASSALGAQLRKSAAISEQDEKASLHVAWRNASKVLANSPEMTLKHWERYKKSIDASNPMVQFMWYELAEKANRKMKRYNRAADLSLQLIEISYSLTSAHRGKAFNLLGISLRHLYAYTMSATSYRCAITHYPDDHRKLASVYNNLAIVQQRMGRLDASISLFQHAIRLGQRHADMPQSTYLTNLAIISARAGLYENAVNYLKQAMFLETNDIEDEKRLKSLTYLLFSLTELKDWTQVDRISREVERRSTLATDSSTYFLYQWVQMHYQHQRFQQKPPEKVLEPLIKGYEKASHSGAQFIYERVAKTMGFTISKEEKPTPIVLTSEIKQRVQPLLAKCSPAAVL